MWYPEIEIVFHCGTWELQNSKMSVIRRIDGFGGKMYVPRAMYSFKMSFWIVPDSFSIDTPCFSPTAMYSPSSTPAGALIVIDVDTLSSGIPSNSVSMSDRLSIATPTLPTSPCAMAWSES